MGWQAGVHELHQSAVLTRKSSRLAIFHCKLPLLGWKVTLLGKCFTIRKPAKTENARKIRAAVGGKINSVRKSTRESVLELSRFIRSVHVSKVLSLIRVAAESLLNDWPISNNEAHQRFGSNTFAMQTYHFCKLRRSDNRSTRQKYRGRFDEFKN